MLMGMAWLCSYPSDDINKFLWMVRIGGGVFPDIKEPDYLGERGYTIDDKAGKVRAESFNRHMLFLPVCDTAEIICSIRCSNECQQAQQPTAILVSSVFEPSTALLQAMLDCIMYKMSYYRFAQAAEMTTGRYGFDRVRNTNIGVPEISLKYFEEVYTTEHWMVRIYEVKDQPSRDFHVDSVRKGRNQLKRVSPSGKSRTPPTW